MQCKKCNAFIPEGYMYCPVCGEEIIIVSDFEIKLEDNIDMSAIANTIELPDVENKIKEKILLSQTQEIPDVESIDDELQDVDKILDDEEHPMNPRWWILIVAVSVFVIAGGVIAGINVSRYLSYDFQYNKGILLHLPL